MDAVELLMSKWRLAAGRAGSNQMAQETRLTNPRVSMQILIELMD